MNKIKINWDFSFEEEFGGIDEFIEVPKNIKRFDEDDINEMLYKNYENTTSIGEIIINVISNIGLFPDFNIKNFEGVELIGLVFNFENWNDEIDIINIKKCFKDKNNRIELWYLNKERWFCIIQEDEKVFIIENDKSYLEIITNKSRFSFYNNIKLKIKLELLKTPEDIINMMKKIVVKTILLQIN